MNTNTLQKNILSRALSMLTVATLLFSSVPAPAYAALFAPGATLNPNCLPTDPNCGVDTSLFSLSATSTAPATTTNKLYNQNGTLYWNGIALGSASSTVVTALPIASSTNSVTSGLLFVDGNGNLVQDATNINYNPTSHKLTLTGGLDPLYLQVKDISGAGAAYFESYDGNNAAVSAANTGRIRYSTTTQTFQVSENTGAYTSIQKALTGALGQVLSFNSSGNPTAVATSTLGIALSDTTGTLGGTRGGTGLSAVTQNSLLIGGAGNTWTQVATSSLGLLTTNVAEGSNQYYTDARARASQSVTATGLTYTAGTGATSLTAGYNIPLTASTTNWNTFYNTPSTRITAGSGLGWSGNTLAVNTGALSYASATTDGIVSTTTQTFAGAKTFTGTVTANGTVSVLGVATLATTTAGSLTASTAKIGTLAGLLFGTTGNVGTIATSSLGLREAITGTQGHTITFDAAGSQVSTSTLFIASSGNIGIGTTTPSTKLAIAGGFSVSTQTQTGTQTNPNLISTGGTVSVSGADTIITYTATSSNGTFRAPDEVQNVRVLMVAGGGGGGANGGGGGGAGGFREFASMSVNQGQQYTVIVGSGNLGSGNTLRGSKGGDSSFNNATSTGGGGGGSRDGSEGTGGSGGSGGGGGGPDTSVAGGAGNTPSVTPSQGNGGGTNFGTAANQMGAGGGGSYSAGVNAASLQAGAGGAGATSTITGSEITYAGGGGGGKTVNGTVGAGGSGGGGGAGNNGTNGLGGGGGGGGNGSTAVGGRGGSGIVVVRFATVAATATSSQALFRVTNAGTDTSSVLAFFETGASQSCIIAGGSGLSCSSDKNLKKDIEATSGMLGSVLALKPVTYNWRTAEELGIDGFDPYATAEGVTGEQVGFIAQDVEQLFPGLVRIDPNGNRTLAYDKFAPLIVAAMQEQYGGMMGVNIASVGDMAELFSSTTTLALLDDDGYEYTDIVTDPIGYITERVEAGIKVVRTLAAERMVAVEASFKRIFANELCLVDEANGTLVCVDAGTLRNLNGVTERSLTAPKPEEAPVVESDSGEPAKPQDDADVLAPADDTDDNTDADNDASEVIAEDQPEEIIEETPASSEVPEAAEAPVEEIVNEEGAVTEETSVEEVAEPEPEVVEPEPASPEEQATDGSVGDEGVTN